jgi:hypothetical protein
LHEGIFLETHFSKEFSEFDGILKNLERGTEEAPVIFGEKLVGGKQNALRDEVLDYVPCRHEVQLPVNNS